MEIVRVLATGGFGIVYLGHDHLLDREVAIKEYMPLHLAGRSDSQRVALRSQSDAESFEVGLRSFIDEAQLLARISHPCVVKVYRFWEANGTGYMVMPRLRGPTLADVRRSMSGPPNEDWLRSVMAPLLDALSVLHANGVYHRDVAPDNVLLADGGLPMLLDFGAARRVVHDPQRRLTAIIKPGYAPIEQFGEAASLRQGPWTDLYALGATMAFLIHGYPPPISTARLVQDEMEPLGEQHIPGIGPCFLGAIDWALSVRPQDRPQSVSQLREALDGPPRRQALPVRRETPRALVVAASDLRRSDLAMRRGSIHGAAAVLTLAALGFAWSPSDAPSGKHAGDTDAVVHTTVAQTPKALAVEGPRHVDDAPLNGTAPGGVTSATFVDTRGSAAERASAAPVGKVHKVPGKRRLKDRPRPTSTLPDSARGEESLSAVDACAQSSFLTRSYCIDRRCQEPGYRSAAQCRQLRQLQATRTAARLDHY